MTKEDTRTEKQKATDSKVARKVAGLPPKKKGKAKPKKVEITATNHKNGLPKGPGKNPCACGCDGTTNGTFQQGHDARVYSTLRKIASGDAKVGHLPLAIRNNKPLLKAMRAKVH
jgi:hypothetical protein